GPAERGLRIDATVPREARDGEEQIADLVLELSRRLGLVDLAELLVDLGARAARVLPVEADRGRLLADARRPEERREGEWDAAEHAGAPLLPGLHGLPPLAREAVLLGRVTEHPRVPTDHLRADRVDHVVELEPALRGGELRLEDDLKKEVAQLFLERGWLAPIDGVDHLERLLDDERAEALERLRAVPRA